MACYHPLKAFCIGINPENGKKVIKIYPYEIHHIEKRNGIWYPCNTELISPYREAVIYDYIEVPCGKCLGCRLDYSKQWANRCMLELEYHKDAYFVTLTYNDEHVPRSYYSDPETGEALESLTLKKRDFQLFMKRLRKRVCSGYEETSDYYNQPLCCTSITDGKPTIRFFASAEYGSTTFRPHYHAIIFGLKINDLQVYKRDRGFTYYFSPALQDVWSVQDDGVLSPLGYVVVAPVTWETCAYTARYVMKKLAGAEAQFYMDVNITPPFTLMSRKPGIARQWYDDHPCVYDYEYINISTPQGGRKFRPPKYFDRLFEIEEPEKMAEVKDARRRMAEHAKKLKLKQTTQSYLEMLETEEHALEDRISTLRREL